MVHENPVFLLNRKYFPLDSSKFLFLINKHGFDVIRFQKSKCSSRGFQRPKQPYEYNVEIIIAIN